MGMVLPTTCADAIIYSTTQYENIRILYVTFDLYDYRGGEGLADFSDSDEMLLSYLLTSSRAHTFGFS